jgi:hypothetical protein
MWPTGMLGVRSTSVKQLPIEVSWRIWPSKGGFDVAPAALAFKTAEPTLVSSPTARNSKSFTVTTDSSIDDAQLVDPRILAWNGIFSDKSPQCVTPRRMRWRRHMQDGLVFDYMLLSSIHFGGPDLVWQSQLDASVSAHLGTAS